MANQSQLPDARGHFGRYGGRFVPETLVPALDELEAAFRAAQADPQFQEDLGWFLADYAGRPGRRLDSRRAPG